MIMPRRPGQTAANHVLSIVMDQHNCHAMTEELLDTWWNSLAPEQKAEIHLASLDAPEESAHPIPDWIAQGLAQAVTRLTAAQQRAAEILDRPLAALPSTQH